MKKILLFFMTLFVAVAAQAWTVNFTNPNGWSKVNVYTFNNETCGSWPGKAMTLNGDVWTYTGTGNPGKIIFNNGSGAQTGNLDFVDGATYDMNGPIGAQLNTYTVYFRNDDNWANVYVYTFSPELCGGWPGKKLTKGADGLYALELQATSEPECGGIIFNNGSGTQTANLTYEVGATYNPKGNIKDQVNTYTMSLNNTAEWEKVYVYTFNPEVCGTWPGKELTKGADGLYAFEYEATSTPAFGGVIFNNGNGLQTADLTFEDGAVVTNGPAPGEDLYLVGDMTGWDTVDVYKFTKEDNVYTLVVGDGLAGAWKIWNGTWDYNFGGNGNELQNGVEADAWFKSGSNFTSNFGGKTTIVFTLVEGSDVNDSTIPSKITVTAESVLEPKPISEWYVSVQGEFNNWDGVGIHPDATGVATFTELPGAMRNGFKIKVWNGIGDVWHCNGQALEVGKWISIPDNNDVNMTVTAATDDDKFNVSYNCNTEEVKVEIAVQDGIANVAVDANAPAEYYNMQGVRVAQPTTGLYILRQGGKATKVMVK